MPPFAAIKQQRVDAAMLAGDPMLLSQRVAIASLASQHPSPWAILTKNS